MTRFEVFGDAAKNKIRGRVAGNIQKETRPLFGNFKG